MNSAVLPLAVPYLDTPHRPPYVVSEGGWDLIVPITE